MTLNEAVNEAMDLTDGFASRPISNTRCSDLRQAINKTIHILTENNVTLLVEYAINNAVRSTANITSDVLFRITKESCA